MSYSMPASKHNPPVVETLCGVPVEERIGRGVMQIHPGVIERLSRRVQQHPAGACSCHEALKAARYLERLPALIEPVPTGDGEILYRGEMGVDVAAMWKMMTKDVYGDSDLPMLAAREALQNSVDAVQMAIRGTYVDLEGNRRRVPDEYKIGKDEGFFSITWEPYNDGSDRGSLTFEDNGIGMDYYEKLDPRTGRMVGKGILVEKFLVLGASGKSGDDNAAGGFGVAKAVILGCSPTGRWEVHTRNFGVKPIPGSMSYDIYKMPKRQGTKVIVHDIADSEVYAQQFRGKYTVEQRMKMVLGFSDTLDPGAGRVYLLYNGVRVAPTFPRTAGHKVAYEYDWGSGNDIVVKSYRRTSGSGNGNFYFRLSGLIQFIESPGYESMMKADVILDVHTTNRPQSEQYPFNASRDKLKPYSGVYHAFNELKRRFVQESSSATEPREYDTYRPDATDPKEREGAAEFGEALRDATDDAEFRNLYQGLMDRIADYIRETTPYVPPQEAGLEPGAPPAPGLPNPYAGFRARQAITPTEIDVENTTEGRQRFGEILDSVLKEAEGGDHGSLVSGETERILNGLKAGGTLSAGEATFLFEIVQRAADKIGGDPDQTGTSNMGGVLELSGLLKLIASAANADPYTPESAKEEIRKKAKDINPFGTAAMVKVSRVNYDKKKGRKFLKNAKKYMPLLVVWDVTLRMIAKEAGIQIAFRPGFVLDDSVRALAASEGEAGSSGYRNYVLLHPDPFMEYVKAHKDRPHAVAVYLHATACHELAHLPRMGGGHNEAFTTQREELEVATAHLLPAIERSAIKMLGLTPFTTPGEKARIKEAVQKALARKHPGFDPEAKATLTKIREENKRLASDLSQLRDKLGQEYESRIADLERCEAITSASKTTVANTVARLNALAQYHDFRQFVLDHGSLYLEGISVTPTAVVSWFDENPQKIAALILDQALKSRSSTTETLRVPASMDPDMPAEYQDLFRRGTIPALGDAGRATTTIAEALQRPPTKPREHVLTSTEIARLAADEKLIRKSFWSKTKSVLGKVPFVPDAVAMYYTMLDPATPLWAKAAAASALAYFVSPVDVIPDAVPVAGYADDAAAILTAMQAIRPYVTDQHREQAKAWFGEHKR